MASTNDPHGYELREAELQRQEQRAERWERTAPPVESERVWCVTALGADGTRRAVYTGCTQAEAGRFRGCLPSYVEPRVERQAETREAGQ